jgi:hypothetical protein
MSTTEGISHFLKSPIPSLLNVALLRYLPAYGSILPLYVTLMLWAPFALALALWDVRIALLVSAGIYAVGRGPSLALERHHGGWYFNPLTWQLVFTIGIVCAVLWRDGLPRPSPRLLKLSAAVVLIAAIMATSAVGSFSALHLAAVAHLDINKPNLGLVRLVNFLAMAYLIGAAVVTPDLAPGIRQLIDGRFGRALQIVGRNSLAIFATGALLSLIGREFLRAADFASSAHFHRPIGLATALMAVCAQFAISRRIERQSSARASHGLARANTLTSSCSNRAAVVARHLSILLPWRVKLALALFRWQPPPGAAGASPDGRSPTARRRNRSN